MNAPRENRQVAVFEVGSDQFAVDILTIREIARHQPIRSIPRGPDFLEGVIDLRENLVPVIDLHDRLDLEPTVSMEQSRIIIAPIGDLDVGFLVDTVRDVIELPPDEVKQPPQMGSAPSFLEGVIRSGEEIILLLDMTNILDTDEKLHVEELRWSLERGEAGVSGGRPSGGGKKKTSGGKAGTKRGSKASGGAKKGANGSGTSSGGSTKSGKKKSSSRKKGSGKGESGGSSKTGGKDSG